MSQRSFPLGLTVVHTDAYATVCGHWRNLLDWIPRVGYNSLPIRGFLLCTLFYLNGHHIMDSLKRHVSRPCSTRRRLGSLLAVSLLAGILIAAGCNTHLVTFQFTEKDKQTVEGSLTGKLAGQLGLDFDIDLESQLQKRDLKAAKKVYVKALSFEITKNSDGRNFDFLESITLKAESSKKDARRFAWKNDVPKGVQQFDLQVDDTVNLKPYIEQGLTIVTEANGSPPGEDTTFNAVISLQVKAL